MIYIPIFYDQLLMFAVQLEADQPAGVSTIGNFGNVASASKDVKASV